MSDDKAFGPIDPNSQHQLWSRWIIGIQAARQRPTVQEVNDNARRFFKQLFHSSVGRVKCEEQSGYYAITLEIEGIPAHDPGVRRDAEMQFERNFVKKGFGTEARLTRFIVGILAGDQQDGKPPEQLLVMPHVSLTKMMGEVH